MKSRKIDSQRANIVLSERMILSVETVNIVENNVIFGIYACNPEDSSFKATFTNMEITKCKWLAHHRQAPDESV